MSDRVAKLRYCVAHFEHPLRQGASTEMAKVYLAELMAARAQRARPSMEIWRGSGFGGG